MSLEKIIAISGKPGLYELISQTRGGFVVNALNDGKKQSISMRNNVSVLNEISIYTYSEEVPLSTVLQSIKDKEKGAQTLSHKASKKELENFLRSILPEYDEDRVYPSDIKKIVQWYNLLQKSDLLNDLSTKTTETEEAVLEEE